MGEGWPTLSQDRSENAYKILFEKHNVYVLNATQQSVLRKINSLRCAYSK
jgi:hypothetical protein